VPWSQVLSTVSPVFALAAIGYAFGARLRIDLASVTQLVVYLAGPALIFTGLVDGPLEARSATILVLGVVIVVVGVGGLVVAITSLTGRKPGALLLPAMFMNSGNMLLPLSLFAFGEPGLRHAIVIFVTVAVLQSSLGVAIASGRASMLEMFRLPYIYAVLAALLVRVTGASVPAFLARVLELVGGMAIPLMLFALGLRLRSVRLTSWRAPLLITLARIFGGYAIAAAYVACTGIEGTTRSCLLLASVMPAAVINFVFAEKYGAEAGEVAATVAVSTFVSLLTTPLLLAFGL